MEKFKFARKCDVTGEGMNEGWVINGGVMYIKYEADALAHAQEQGYDSIQALYDACEEEGDSDGFYWTEWESIEEMAEFCGVPADEWYESPYEDGREAVLVSAH
jgi:hypothetical protein